MIYPKKWRQLRNECIYYWNREPVADLRSLPVNRKYYFFKFQFPRKTCFVAILHSNTTLINWFWFITDLARIFLSRKISGTHNRARNTFGEFLIGTVKGVTLVAVNYVQANFQQIVARNFTWNEMKRQKKMKICIDFR